MGKQIQSQKVDFICTILQVFAVGCSFSVASWNGVSYDCLTSVALRASLVSEMAKNLPEMQVI